MKGDVKNNISYLDETVVLYPAGHNTVLYNTDNRTQKFINGTDGSDGITALAVTPNKRMVAVAESSDRGIVNLYDLNTLRKRKQLSTGER